MSDEKPLPPDVLKRILAVQNEYLCAEMPLGAGTGGAEEGRSRGGRARPERLPPEQCPEGSAGRIDETRPRIKPEARRRRKLANPRPDQARASAIG